MRAMLSFAGRNAPLIPFLGVFLELLLPPLARLLARRKTRLARKCAMAAIEVPVRAGRPTCHP